jgi:hypothetical protein
MARAAYRSETMKVKSFRLSVKDIGILQAYENAEQCTKTEALRDLLQYGILYYTMQVISDEEVMEVNQN